MPTYNFEGKTREGLVKKGVIVADSVAAAESQLRAQSVMPTTIKAKPKDLTEIIPMTFKE